MLVHVVQGRCAAHTRLMCTCWMSHPGLDITAGQERMTQCHVCASPGKTFQAHGVRHIMDWVLTVWLHLTHPCRFATRRWHLRLSHTVMVRFPTTPGRAHCCAMQTPSLPGCGAGQLRHHLCLGCASRHDFPSGRPLCLMLPSCYRRWRS